MALEIVQINESTWRIEDSMVRMFLLKGNQEALLIDSGVSGSDVKTLAESLVSVPVRLINTHADRDHIASNHLFHEFMMHHDEIQDSFIQLKYPDKKIIALKDGDELDLGNRLLKVIHICGHTRGSLAVLDVQSRVLYSGDSVQDGHIFMFGKHRAPEDFDASLSKLMTFSDEYDLIYPSHGTPVLPKDYVSKVQSVWRSVSENQLKSSVKQIHGKEVLCYEHEDCGFYCDLSE